MYFKDKNIYIDNNLVAKIFRYEKKKFKGIKFFTPDHFNIQLGLMVHSKNHIIKPHIHINKKRIIRHMSEFLIILSGKLKVYFYNKAKIRIKSVTLNKKDMILLLTGAHGFKVMKKVEMLEIKQGPFKGNQDKIRLKKL